MEDILKTISQLDPFIILLFLGCFIYILHYIIYGIIALCCILYDWLDSTYGPGRYWKESKLQQEKRMWEEAQRIANGKYVGFWKFGKLWL